MCVCVCVCVCVLFAKPAVFPPLLWLFVHCLFFQPAFSGLAPLPFSPTNLPVPPSKSEWWVLVFPLCLYTRHRMGMLVVLPLI